MLRCCPPHTGHVTPWTGRCSFTKCSYCVGHPICLSAASYVEDCRPRQAQRGECKLAEAGRARGVPLAAAAHTAAGHQFQQTHKPWLTHVQGSLPGAQLLGVQCALAAARCGWQAKGAVLAEIGVLFPRLEIHVQAAGGAAAGSERGPQEVERQEGKEQAEAQAWGQLGQRPCMPRRPHGAAGPAGW